MAQSKAVDQLMEQASAALLATAYFKVESLCIRAMEAARRGHDHETMSRIVLPLQEARRQRRHMAVDSGHVEVLCKLPRADTVLQPGCYLLRPPLIGADAPMYRELAFSRQIPAVFLTREPRTSGGRWPIVAIIPGRSFRVQFEAPANEDEGPDAAWFMKAIEAVGDVALARLKPEDPAAFRVEDAWEAMSAIPEHEKLHQRFADECRLAMKEPRPDKVRRRGVFEDMSSF